MTKLYISSLDQNYIDLNTKIVHKSKYVLATYYYLRQKTNNSELMNIIAEYNKSKRLIIDSGAFSFMNGKTITEQKLDDYCSDYVSFLKKYSINQFVEMDIDSILGFDKTMEYRTYIEQSLNNQCIPIFHKSRGKSEFAKMVNDYSYAGIGGIAIKNIKPNEWKYFKQLNSFANSHSCKLHAMGFTPTKKLNDYGFYSCDSSSWTMGVRFGNLYRFNGQSIKSIKKPPHSRLVLPGEKMKKDQHSKTYELAVTAIIAALYCALGIVFSAISFGAIQVRISCALYQLVAYNKKYFWGLLIGNVLVNLTSPLGWYDMVFGVATGALGTGVAILLNHFASKMLTKKIITAISVTFFTFFVAWELVLVAHVPFWATWLTVACGQAISQIIGVPLMTAIDKRVKLAHQI